MYIYIHIYIYMKKIYKILTGSFAVSLILTATVVTPIECIRNSSNNCQTNAINVDHNKNQLNQLIRQILQILF